MTFISIHIIANQNSCHVDKSAQQCLTRVICPQLIKNVRTRRRIDSSSIIAHPVNFAIYTCTQARNMKPRSRYMCRYTYIDIALSIITWILLYRLATVNHVAILSGFQCFKEVFQKLADMWLVGEVVNHVGLYGCKAAESYSAFQHRCCNYHNEIRY